MSNREIALHALRSPIAHKINFSFVARSGLNIFINQRTFEGVAAAIERGAGVQGGISLITTTRMPVPNAAALYFPEEDASIKPPVPANTILVSPLNGLREQGQLLHEAVHASFDLTRTRLPVVDNEAAAYIAIALHNRFVAIPPRSQAPLIIHAFAVADSVLNTGRVDAAALANLRNTIASLPDYNWAGMKGCYVSNG